MIFFFYLIYLFLPELNALNSTNKDSVFYFGGHVIKESQFHFFSENKNFCGIIVPGLHRMTRGVDITNLDLFHNYNLNDQDGFMSCSFLDLTCKKKRKLILNGIGYDVPDQISSIDLIEKENLLTDFAILNNLSDIKSEIKKTVTLEKDYPKGAFTNSEVYTDFRNILLNTTKFLSIFKTENRAFKIHLAPRTSLRKSLSEFMNDFINEELPENYNDAPEKYKEFISLYGTHYFKNGLFGGAFLLVSEIESSLKHLMQFKEISTIVENHHRTIVNRKGVSIKSNNFKDDTKLVKEKMTTKQFYFGGDELLLEIDKYDSWLPTIIKNPWLIGGDLAPITDLVKSDQIRKELSKAIDIHIGLSYIKECERLLHTQLRKFPNKINKFAPMIEKIQKLNSNISVTLEEVQGAIKSLESIKMIVKLLNFRLTP